MTKVTVLMPCYNAEKTIKQAIESILNQSYQDFIFYIINDGSTDNSEQIIKQFKDERIVYIKQENKGIATSLKEALKNIQTEYVMRMDSDDISHPQRLEKLLEFLSENPNISLVSSKVVPFIDENTVNFKTLPKQNIVLYDTKQLRSSLLLNNNMIAHPSVIFNLNHLKRLNLNYFDDINYYAGEDYYLWTKFLFKANAATLKDDLLFYRVSKQSSISSKAAKQRDELHFVILKELFDDLNLTLNEKQLRLWINLGLKKQCELSPLQETVNELLFQLSNNSNIAKKLDIDFLARLIEYYSLNKINISLKPNLLMVEVSSGPNIYGIEKAQLIRHSILKKLNQRHKFVYTLFPNSPNFFDNFYKNGFPLNQIELVYLYFSDIQNKVCSFTFDDLKKMYQLENYQVLKQEDNIKIIKTETNLVLECIFNSNQKLTTVRIYQNQQLSNELLFTYTLFLEKIIVDKDIYQYRFYNEDGSIAYIVEQENDLKTYYLDELTIKGEEAFLNYYFHKQNLSDKDVIILERPNPKLSFLMNKYHPYCLGYYIHFDYRNVRNAFNQHVFKDIFKSSSAVDFYITTTKLQIPQIKEDSKQNCDIFYLPTIYTTPQNSNKQVHLDKVIRFVTASRMTKEKRLDQAIQIIKQANNQGFNCNLTIVGSGILEADLKKLAKDLDIEDKIIFAGFHQNLEVFYKQADFYLSTSSTEAFATSLLEAMSHGLPIIAKNVPFANQEYINHGVNGYLISNYQNQEDLIKEYLKYISKITKLTTENYQSMCSLSLEKSKTFDYNSLLLKWDNFLKNMQK